MINKDLLNLIPESKKYIGLNILFKVIALLVNIGIIFLFVSLFNDLLEGSYSYLEVTQKIVVMLLLLFIKYFSTLKSDEMSFLSSKNIKLVLREKIYSKILSIGVTYNRVSSTSEITQLATEGVEQIESYFGAFIPQLFYSILAAFILFIILLFINIPVAFILLIGVPLIPILIMGIQRIAKKLLGNYWKSYSSLGDKFLENIQGLTTLKIYKADDVKNKEMNIEASRFRKITMKVLTFQLNSIAIMDIVAYGGAALGIGIGLLQYSLGNISFSGTLLIILLSADFFIPMRILGSYFHITMNGMAASKKIFNLLNTDINRDDTEEFPLDFDNIVLKKVYFGFDRVVLKDINMRIPKLGLIGIVGESGSGKSTLASILVGKNRGYKGDILVGDRQLANIQEEELLKNITYIGTNPYLFKGSVRENLLVGNIKATDEELLSVLKEVYLDNFTLDMELEERGSNISGGQKQKLAIARALLKDSRFYIFDEATSNIDVESELEINQLIFNLSKEKGVVYISHRLGNIVKADRLYVLEKGCLVQVGDHNRLSKVDGVYKGLWDLQSSLEKDVYGVSYYG